MSDASLKSGLASIEPQISRLKALSGVPSLSYGVFHHGKIIHTAHLGTKSILTPNAPATDDTIYPVASLLKILTVSLVASLVHQDVLAWDVPIKTYIPKFGQRPDKIGQETTIRDLILNRTGLPLGLFYWTQQNGETLISKSDILDMARDLPAVKPFRAKFLYSQWNYCLLQLVIEAVTGREFEELIDETIIKPLGLKNTTFGIPDENVDVITPHAVRDDGTADVIKTGSLEGATGMAAGGGGKTSLEDLMTIYIKLLSAYEHQKREQVDVTPGSPFVLLREIFTPQLSPQQNPASSNQHYCFGLYRSTLPANLSIASWNSIIFGSKLPEFGTTIPGTEVYHHPGTLPGSLGSVLLVPGTNSGVVVLTNATPLFDASDLVAQHLLGVLLGERRPPQVLKVAEQGPKILKGIYKGIEKLVESGKTDEPPSLPLEMYAGVYLSKVGCFHLQVVKMEGGLRILVQGNERVTYDLLPYGEDRFYWPVDREKENCEKGMWPQVHPPVHVVSFDVSNGVVKSLVWHHDALADPEEFTRDAKRSRL